MADDKAEEVNHFSFDIDRHSLIVKKLTKDGEKITDDELRYLLSSGEFLRAKLKESETKNSESVRRSFPKHNRRDKNQSKSFHFGYFSEQVEPRQVVRKRPQAESLDYEKFHPRVRTTRLKSNGVKTRNSAEDSCSDSSDMDLEPRRVEDRNTKSHKSKAQVPLNKPCVNLESFVNEEKSFLMLRKKPLVVEDEIRREKQEYPLGVVYDEVVKVWFSCERENDKIMLLNIEGEGEESSVDVITHPLIMKPTALAIYEEGKSLAILTSVMIKNCAILIYDHVTKKIDCFANYKEKQFGMHCALRGLAKSMGGNLISVSLKKGKGKLRVFKRDVGGLSFEIPNATNPSFISSCAELVAVSDLGNNNVYVMRLNDTDWERTEFSVLKVLEPEVAISRPIYDTSNFLFVAGLQFDTNRCLLIGDARGGTLKLFDEDLNFIHRVSTDFVIPYMSSFWVNKKGQMLIIDIHGVPDKYVFAKFAGRRNVGPHLGPPDKDEVFERRL